MFNMRILLLSLFLLLSNPLKSSLFNCAEDNVRLNNQMLSTPQVIDILRQEGAKLTGFGKEGQNMFFYTKGMSEYFQDSILKVRQIRGWVYLKNDKKPTSIKFIHEKSNLEGKYNPDMYYGHEQGVKLLDGATCYEATNNKFCLPWGGAQVGSFVLQERVTNVNEPLELDFLDVNNQYQGQGVGKAILNKILDTLQVLENYSSFYREISLLAQDILDPSGCRYVKSPYRVAFYLNAGFKLHPRTLQMLEYVNIGTFFNSLNAQQLRNYINYYVTGEAADPVMQQIAPLVAQMSEAQLDEVIAILKQDNATIINPDQNLRLAEINAQFIHDIMLNRVFYRSDVTDDYHEHNLDYSFRMQLVLSQRGENLAERELIKSMRPLPQETNFEFAQLAGYLDPAYSHMPIERPINFADIQQWDTTDWLDCDKWMESNLNLTITQAVYKVAAQPKTFSSLPTGDYLDKSKVIKWQQIPVASSCGVKKAKTKLGCVTERKPQSR